MRFFNLKSVRFKIVVYTTLCLAAVGLASNLYLYTYMNGIIEYKAESIDNLYFDTIQMQLDTRFSQMRDLAALCKSNTEVTRLLNNASMASLSVKKTAMQAQNVLNEYLHSFNLDGYVNKLIAFNESGVMVQAVAQVDGALGDYHNLMTGGNFATLAQSDAPAFSLMLPSITPYRGESLAGLFPLNTPPGRGGACYIYIELKPQIVLDTLAPYAKLNPIFAGTANNKLLLEKLWAGAQFAAADLTGVEDGAVLHSDSASYKVHVRSLSSTALKLYNCTDLSAISVDDQKMGYTIAVVILSVLVVSVCLVLIISSSITSPIKRLIARIRRIAANDFSYDPEIERSGDEIAEIGKVINEMMMSITALLRENDEQNELRRNIEISLLQSQVNPHFLYNTLDSIHWMAVIQKSPGISQMTQSLSHLLKNLAKGTQDRIPLSEELSLLKDYVSIQAIRYLEAFDVIIEVPEDLLSCRIIKFTLQPLVENAIFHGIEPTGMCGIITVRAWEEADCILITVHDTGKGMSEEAMARLLSSAPHEKNTASLNGIGVYNVDQRLKLVYGKAYGLSFASELGKYTCVTVKIPKEAENV